MSTISLVGAVQPRVTLKDVAAKAGCAPTTAWSCLNGNKGKCKYSQAMVAKVQTAASQLGYTKEVAASNIGGLHKFKPANPVFASRTSETTAMMQLRSAGHTNKEVAHRCGVCVNTVNRRIGAQPAELTTASKKLAGKVSAAKRNIKRAYVQQQTVTQYNELAAKLNAQLEAAQKMAAELSAMQKKAVSASKATKVPLLRIMQGGVAS